MPEAPAAGGAASQQAPFGTSSATGPTPNAGFKAAAFQKLGMMANQLAEILPLLGATSEEGQVVQDVLRKLTKLVPVGSTSAQGDKNALEQAMLKNQQNSAMQQQMKQGAAQQAKPQAPPSMPSMPG